MHLTRILELSDLAPGPRGVSAAVSLHAHTSYSREVARDLPVYIEQIPVIAPLYRRELAAYRGRRGQDVDFSKGWWHPPASPDQVWRTEVEQIERLLGLAALVSISDHDDIRAPVALARGGTACPISLEWTVPFGPGFFHLGVHNLPASRGPDIAARLCAFAECPHPEELGNLLDDLNDDRDTLVVLNHPMWDLARVGTTRHAALLRTFLSTYRDRVHAVEFNGYRSREENVRVCALSEDLGVPVVSGGDRHGLTANAVVNLTTASSWGGFVREIREWRMSQILILPAYRDHLVARKLAVVADVLRPYPANPAGPRRWIDRVSCEWQGQVRPLAFHWPDGGPVWVRAAVMAFRALTSPVAVALLRHTCLRRDTVPLSCEIDHAPALQVDPVAV